MMKKIFISMFVFSIFSWWGIETVNAYEGGFLHGKNIKVKIGGFERETVKLTDGDLSTGETFLRDGDGLEVLFPEAINVKKMRFSFTTTRTNEIAVFIDYKNGGATYIQVYKSDLSGRDILLNLENVKRIRVISNHSVSSAGTVKIDEFDIFIDESEIYSPITNLIETHDHESVNLKWKNPVDGRLSEVQILQDGFLIDTLQGKEEYLVKNLASETMYKFEVIAKYSNGMKSTPAMINVMTAAKPKPKPAGDIEELKAEIKYNRVDLSWTLPHSENLKHVIIYRDTLKKSFFDKMLGVRTVKAATPIFETNGTYFNDLTVEPETKYEYTLTTMSTEKVESDGVTVQVTTPKEPDPVIEDGGFEKDPEKGDYTYTWKATTGEVKVMVGGKLYKTVPASDGKIVIPAADMKFTLLGKPNVELIPVRADGTEGKPVSPPVSGGGGEGGTGAGMKEIELPFKLNDLVLTTFQMIGLLAGIILIALAIQLVPRLIEIIKKSIQNGRTVRK